MQPADRKEFLRVLNGLAAIKPGGKLAPEALDMWWLAMSDWSIEAFKDAAAHLAKSVEFMPSPFHFQELRKAGRITAAEAWETARAACGSAIQCGQVTHNGTCGDALIDKAVRGIGGYGAIAMCDREKLPFLERRFTETFNSLQDVTEVRESLPAIAGAPERLRLGVDSLVRKLGGPKA